jgi:energy-coupling factor transporter ATP-binding protein EcfA2
MAVFEAVSGRKALPEGDNLSGPADEYLQPLCPLRIHAHKDRYLSIDGYEERFKEFRTYFAEPVRWTDKGHLVVVTGDRGYGKTSLIQRCALWLQEEARQHCEIVVVDLTDERWPATETEPDRLSRTLDWMLDALRHALQAHEVSMIKSHTDMMSSFRDLGRVLRLRKDGDGNALPPIVLAVLLQGYPRPSEIARYYTLARPGTFFFAEMFDREDIARLSAIWNGFNRTDIDRHLLNMEVLKSGDARLLVDWIRREGGSWPEVPDEIIMEHFDGITKYKIGMAELAKLTWGTLGVAAAESAERVTVNHIARYYEQMKFVRSV